MPEDRLTKNQRRDAAREAARIAREKAKRREAVNSILLRGGVTLGIVAVLAIVGLVIFNSIRPAGPGPLNMASDGIVLTGPEMSAVPTVATPAEGEPTPTDAESLGVPLHLQVYVDYQCPHCMTFETANASVIEQFVTTGQAAVELHPISILASRFSARAANAMACVAENAPDSFWAANAAMFTLQSAGGSSGPSDAQLTSTLEAAGVTAPGLANCISGNAFGDWVREATDRATSDPLLANPASGGFSTPTVMVNGQRYPGPIDDPNVFAAFLASLLPAGDEGEPAE